MSIQIENQHIYDVVIIGAGPVGLAIANGLYQRGIDNLLVLDKTREFRQVGQGIDLLPNGLKALKYINTAAYEEVKKTGKTKSSNWNQIDLSGNLLRSMSQQFDDWSKKYNEGRVSIHWHELQTILRNHLPKDKILNNHYCTGVHKDLNCNYAKIETESNSELKKNPYAYWNDSQIVKTENNQIIEKKTFLSKLIVGADGINSVVRQALFKLLEFDLVPANPEYSGFAGIFGMIGNEIDKDSSKQIEQVYLKNASLVTVRKNINVTSYTPIEEPRMILFKSDKNKFGCAIQGAFEKESISNKEGNELINIVKNKLIDAEFPACLIEVVKKINPQEIKKRLYYTHRATISKNILFSYTQQLMNNQFSPETLPPWFGARIVLAGDAAHGMPPFSGQGTNQGLEDAGVLTNLINSIKNKLDREENIKSIFEKYDCLRRPMLIKLQQLTLGPYSYLNEEQITEYNREIYSRDLNTIIEPKN